MLWNPKNRIASSLQISAVSRAEPAYSPTEHTLITTPILPPLSSNRFWIFKIFDPCGTNRIESQSLNRKKKKNPNNHKPLKVTCEVIEPVSYFRGNREKIGLPKYCTPGNVSWYHDCVQSIQTQSCGSGHFVSLTSSNPNFNSAFTPFTLQALNSCGFTSFKVQPSPISCSLSQSLTWLPATIFH